MHLVMNAGPGGVGDRYLGLFHLSETNWVRPREEGPMEGFVGRGIFQESE